MDWWGCFLNFDRLSERLRFDLRLEFCGWGAWMVTLHVPWLAMEHGEHGPFKIDDLPMNIGSMYAIYTCLYMVSFTMNIPQNVSIYIYRTWILWVLTCSLLFHNSVLDLPEGKCSLFLTSWQATSPYQRHLHLNADGNITTFCWCWYLKMISFPVLMYLKAPKKINVIQFCFIL